MLPSSDAWVNARLRAYEEVCVGAITASLLPQTAHIPASSHEDLSIGISPHLLNVLQHHRFGASCRPLSHQPDRGLVRTAIRFAQADAELEPLEIMAWLEEHAPSFCAVLTEILHTIFDAAQGQLGGEDLALLGWHTLSEALRAEHVRRRDSPAKISVTDLILRSTTLSILEASRGTGPHGAHHGVRLGRSLALGLSPVALGAEPSELAERRMNPYRTIPAAFHLARRVVQSLDEPIRLRSVAATLTERLVVDPKLRLKLRHAQQLETARDAAIALRCLEGDPVVRAMITEPKTLVATLYSAPRRKRLLEHLRPQNSSVAKTLMTCLETAEEDISEPTMRARAHLAAVGALALRLDELLENKRQTLRTQLRKAVDPSDYQASQGLWLEAQAPLFIPPRSGPRALVILAACGTRGTSPNDDKLHTVLEDQLFSPLRRQLDTVPHAGLENIELGRDRFVVAGPLSEILMLAMEWAHTRATAYHQLNLELPPPLATPELPELLELTDPHPPNVEALLGACCPPWLHNPVGIGLAFGETYTRQGLRRTWFRALGKSMSAERHAEQHRQHQRKNLLGSTPRVVSTRPPPGPVFGEDVFTAIESSSKLALKVAEKAEALVTMTRWELVGITPTKPIVTQLPNGEYELDTPTGTKP